MIVAITPRQWSALVTVLHLAEHISALETELGVSFARHEGARFEHRDRLAPLVESAIRHRAFAELTGAFEAQGVTWGPYQSLKQAVGEDPYFNAANPLLVEVDHPSGWRYLTPGPAATLPASERRAPVAAPPLGRDTDQVLAEVLGMTGREIAGLHDRGVVAGSLRNDDGRRPDGSH
jgi:2-methylfumaryl-CoA isomerase